MPKTDSVQYGIDKLYLFPYYQTREQYQKATGHEPPTFNPARPPKHWFDPSADSSQRRNIVYDRVIALSVTGSAMPDENGKPMMEPMILVKRDAATVNLPLSGETVTDATEPGPAAVPVPLRDLEADEELVFTFAGLVAVRKKGALEDGTFTAKDRTMLMAIAKAVGVQV